MEEPPGADPLLADLTADQRDAVTTSATPLCIVAGAGSGKTRVLTRRIAWQARRGDLDPRRVLVVTFTRRAAGELRRRLRVAGLRDDVAAGTFHAIALAQLRRHWADTGRRPPTLLERRTSLLAALHDRRDRAAVTELAAEISWARARLVTPEAYPDAAGRAGRRPRLGTTVVAEAYDGYEREKRRRRLVDFDDLLALCHATHERDPGFAAAQRWRHRHVLVDEFQDVNPLQFALLRAWLGPEPDVVVVGDPDQAIYGWNGADPTLMTELPRHLPGVAVVRLATNFRSTPQILAAAGRVLDRPPLLAVRGAGPPPTVTAVDDEATAVARAVRRRHRPGAPWRRQAVLARTNAQLAPVRAALEGAGIPTRTRLDHALLARPGVADLLESRAPEPLARLVADTALETTADPERRAALDLVADAARDHLALDPEATVADLLSTLRTDDSTGRRDDAVELTTFHGAKGLEWPVVHLVGIEEGLVPIARARTAEAVAEERRLLHVAVTRAEDELHVTWATSRRVGDEVRTREPSRWLAALHRTDDEPPVMTTAALAAARRALPVADDGVRGPDDGDGGDERRRAALLDWREQAARRARTRPAAVLSDAAVEAVLAERPADAEALAALEGVGPTRARRLGPGLLAALAGADATDAG